MQVGSSPRVLKVEYVVLVACWGDCQHMLSLPISDSRWEIFQGKECPAIRQILLARPASSRLGSGKSSKASTSTNQQPNSQGSYAAGARDAEQYERQFNAVNSNNDVEC